MVSERVSEEVKRILSRYPNVVGISNTLKPRVKESTGEVIEEEKCIRVYVSEKLPMIQLGKSALPLEIEGIPVDVVTVGELRALKNGKQERVRPLVAGLSIGHHNITAGSYGWLYTKGKKEYLGSNAHVFTPDPSKPSGMFKGDAILSPGPYDGGSMDDVVGGYVWHKQIKPVASGCRLARGVAGFLNAVSKVLGRKTRFEVIVEEINHIDFAVATKEVEVKLECFEFNPIELGYSLAGHVFAGSNRTGVICKLRPYILDEGYHPVSVKPIKEIKVGDVLRKSGRTSCDTRFRIIDESAQVRVSYGTFTAMFDDVILTENPGGNAIMGGDSGSSAWLLTG